MYNFNISFNNVRRYETRIESQIMLEFRRQVSRDSKNNYGSLFFKKLFYGITSMLTAKFIIKIKNILTERRCIQ